MVIAELMEQDEFLARRVPRQLDYSWHLHPYDAVERHESLSQGLGPKPLLRFLARVEELLLEHDLL